MIAENPSDVKVADINHHRENQHDENALCGRDEVRRKRSASQFADRGEHDVAAIKDGNRQQVENCQANVDQNRYPDRYAQRKLRGGGVPENPHDADRSAHVGNANIGMRIDHAAQRFECGIENILNLLKWIFVDQTHGAGRLNPVEEILRGRVRRDGDMDEFASADDIENDRGIRMFIEVVTQLMRAE